MEYKCRECGSERIAPNLRMSGQSPPGAPPLHLRARVCADCGYTELRAENALDLYLLHMKAVGAGAAAAPAQAAAPAPAANIQCPSCGSVIPAASPVCEACGWSESSP